MARHTASAPAASASATESPARSFTVSGIEIADAHVGDELDAGRRSRREVASLGVRGADVQLEPAQPLPFAQPCESAAGFVDVGDDQARHNVRVAGLAVERGERRDPLAEVDVEQAGPAEERIGARRGAERSCGQLGVEDDVFRRAQLGARRRGLVHRLRDDRGGARPRGRRRCRRSNAVASPEPAMTGFLSRRPATVTARSADTGDSLAQQCDVGGHDCVPEALLVSRAPER